ncbi:putative F-box protein [Prunus yedoensis var. nudiflora]|uniref:Putative F-box protein n=1 Tax=Prunus yedoensis var. nudiflora TaxID=2094558 RepID=A0A314Y253_PRUYE|nr:putative F-box protein [Prunus yedoensis var. nudiflora]
MAQTSPNRKVHDWSSLHQDIVDSIAKRIVSPADLIAFAAVCKAWRSAAIKEYFTSQSTLKSPVLMIQANNKEKGTLTPEFYSSSKSTWSKDINKVRNHHQQQSFSGVPYEFIASKFVLSSSPSWTCDYIVTVIYRILGGWGFWRPGEDEWTSVGRNIMDLAYYKGQFYAVDFDGNIMVCEIAEPEQPKMRIVVPKVPMEPMSASVDQSLYLVESQGALLVVLRLRQWFSSTTEFRVFNVPLEGCGKCWCHWSDLQVKNLGDNTLFLGRHNSSFSIKCKNHKNSVCLGNSICFTVDFCECLALTNGDMDASYFVFNMTDGKIKPCLGKRLNLRAPYLWIQAPF